jgi:hypothetical protein
MTEASTEQAKKPVLVTLGGPNGVPLWHSLSEYYRLAFLDSSAGQLAEQMGVPDVLYVERFIEPAKVNIARAEALWQTWKVMGAVQSGSLLLHPDVDGLRRPTLQGWLPISFVELATAAYVRIFGLIGLLEKEGMAGIVVHEDVTPLGRVAVQFGNAENVPTLHMPHANHFLKPGTVDIHCETIGTYIGASGTYMKDWYEACGVPSSNITVTGGCQFDRFYKDLSIPSKDSARRALGLPADGLVLTYGTTWAQYTGVWGDPEKDLERGWQSMLAAAKEMSAYLLVKMHPGQGGNPEKKYEADMKAAGVKGAISRQHGDFFLRAADCLVTQGSSNLAVEAAILGTPSVELYLCSSKYPDFGPKGTWGEGLAQLILEAIARGPLVDFVQQMNFDNDGKAVERTVEWIRGICQ